TAAIIVLALFVTFALAAGDYFLTANNLENVARQISLDAPLVFGQAIVLIAGGIDISVGATMAMAAALAIGLQPFGTGLAVAAAFAFGLLVGAANGFLVTRGGVVPLVATLRTMSVILRGPFTYTKQQAPARIHRALP